MSEGYLIEVILWGGNGDLARSVKAQAERTLVRAGFSVRRIVQVEAKHEALEKAFSSHREGQADCLLTVGGAGSRTGDVVPAVTGEMIRRSLPGIPEAFRELGREMDPRAPLFRGLAGITPRGSLVVNLPGDDGDWLSACLEYLSRIMAHALDKAGGDTAECAR